MANQQRNNSGTSSDPSSKDGSKGNQGQHLEGAKPSSDHSRNPTDYANGREQASETDRKGH
jgi:hypothetical protein